MHSATIDREYRKKQAGLVPSDHAPVLVESVQRGVRTGLVERGRLLPQSERLIAGFQRKVTEALT